MHNTLSNTCCCVGGLPCTTHFQTYCCVGGIICCVGGLPYTTHFHNVVLEVLDVVLEVYHTQHTFIMLCWRYYMLCWRFAIHNTLS